MNFYYIIAVAGTRVFGVATMLVLLRLMPPNHFGEYVLIATNAMAVYLVLGAWLVAIGNKTLVSNERVLDHDAHAPIATALFSLFVAIGGCAFVTFISFDGRYEYIALTLILALAIIYYESILATHNALGMEKAYAGIAIGRNLLAMIFTVLFVECGLGVFGAVSGLLMGILAGMVATSSGRQLWLSANIRWASLRRIRPNVAFGIGGALQLGAYMLINAPSRNLMAICYGTGAAGIWSLANDMFYGPLALAANAYALTHVRLIYLAVTENSDAELATLSQGLIEFSIILFGIYALGSIFYASDAILILVNTNNANLSALLAVPAAIQSASVVVLYAIVTVALAREKILLVAAMVASTAASSVFFASLGASLNDAAWLAMAGTCASTGFWLIVIAAKGWIYFSFHEFCKLALALIIFGVVALAAGQLFSFDQAWILSALISLIAFVLSSYSFGLRALIGALPIFGRRRSEETCL